MDKLKMHSMDKAKENFAKLVELFPNAVTETIDENGEIVRAIDKDVLMQEISCKVVEGNEERYQFTWPDKKKSILLANAPIAKTLRPCREESVDFDNTQNLYIEGDRLRRLRLRVLRLRTSVVPISTSIWSRLFFPARNLRWPSWNLKSHTIRALTVRPVFSV